MRILIIDNSLDYTGAVKSIIQAISKIQGPDAEFFFLFPNHSKCVDILQRKGYKAEYINFVEISKRVGSLLRYLPMLIINGRKIARYVKRDKIDIIHVNDLYNLTGLIAKLFCKVKVITHVRRMPESFPALLYKIWSRLHIRFANRIIAVSEANKKGLHENNKTIVIYDPLPETEQLPAYLSKTRLSGNAIVLCLANYTFGKGQQHVLEVVKIFKENHPDWTLKVNFYGGFFGMDKNKEYKNWLIAKANELGIASSVFFHDQTQNVEEVMKQHDLILNLSDSESFSRVSLESLFYGIPLVATDVGGTNEMLCNNRTGLLVKAKDIMDMYLGVEKMLLNDELRTSIAARAYSETRQSFGFEQTVEKLKREYYKVRSRE